VGLKMLFGEEKIKDLKDTTQILYLPCCKLHDNELRLNYFAESHIESLVSSIRLTGLIEPIIVSEFANGYKILSGHYRIRAVRRLKRKDVLCSLINCSDKEASIVYCTSNLMTRVLNAIEEAHIILVMLKEKEFETKDIAKIWGRSDSWVNRRLKLLSHLDPALKKEIDCGKLKPRIAQEILKLPQGNEQKRVLKVIRDNYLNKDITAELVNWWILANEEEKKEVELKGFNVCDINKEQLLIKKVTHNLARGQELIEQIVTILEQKIILKWPKEANISFQIAVNRMNKFLSNQIPELRTLIETRLS
jgi:ParB/RepB/Spo0J family partition protein